MIRIELLDRSEIKITRRSQNHGPNLFFATQISFGLDSMHICTSLAATPCRKPPLGYPRPNPANAPIVVMFGLQPDLPGSGALRSLESLSLLLFHAQRPLNAIEASCSIERNPNNLQVRIRRLLQRVANSLGRLFLHWEKCKDAQVRHVPTTNAKLLSDHWVGWYPTAQKRNTSVKLRISPVCKRARWCTERGYHKVWCYSERKACLVRSDRSRATCPTCSTPRHYRVHAADRNNTLLVKSHSRLRQDVEKSWIESTLIMSLRNGGEWGQTGPCATANLKQWVPKNSMFLHIRNNPYFL